MEHALESHHREAAEARDREIDLRERVSTLERLQEAARRTVLDREESLRQTEVCHGCTAAVARRCNRDGSVDANGPGEEATLADGTHLNHQSPRTTASGRIRADKRTPGGVATETDLAEFLGAQKWWLHLAEVESRTKDKDDRTYPAEGDTMSAVAEGVEKEGDKRFNLLRKQLHDQGLEVVTLRQRVLKAEIGSRAKAREEKEHATDVTRRVVTMEHALRTQKQAESTRVAELEGQVKALRARGDMHEALANARNELVAVKLAVVRAKGDVDLHAHLLVS